MYHEAVYRLCDFVRSEVASPDEWQQWQTVKDAAPPRTETRPAPATSVIPYIHETEDPSRDHLRRQELSVLLVNRLRDVLLSGRWKISGRLGPPKTRQDLEAVDWSSQSVLFDRDAIGSFSDVEVREARAETNRELLQRFVERICDAAGQPGKALTKPVIRDLANRLYPENFQEADFAVAWKEANITDDWSKTGPRRKSDSD